MPVGSFKITALLIRTFTKPIANAIKTSAANHPTFRKMCIGFAQWFHRTDFRVRMYLLSERSASKLRPLNDARAIETGASILSEGIVFGVAGVLIVYESVQSANKEAQRRERVADDIAALQDEIEWLKTSLKSQKISLEEYKLPEEINPSILKFPEREARKAFAKAAQESESNSAQAK